MGTSDIARQLHYCVVVRYVEKCCGLVGRVLCGIHLVRLVIRDGSALKPGLVL